MVRVVGKEEALEAGQGLGIARNERLLNNIGVISRA